MNAYTAITAVRPDDTADQIIADRGGATPGYPNDPAKLHACNAWVAHAKPIILAMLMLDDQVDHPLLAARVAHDRIRRWSDPVSWQVRSYDEARAEIKKAECALSEMLEGIRDNFISDERCGIGDTDDETQEADEFNDWLTDNTITVEAAVDAVARERRA